MSTNESSASTSSSQPHAPVEPYPHIKPLQPLALLNCTPKEWKLWKQLWTNYAVVANITARDDQYQKALFLCTIGREALEIYNAFQYEEGQDRDKVAIIISKFDQYFMGDINETYERFKYNQRNQEESESFGVYLTELRNMMKTCNFCGCLTDSLLRDRIVLGIRDDQTRKRLLQERNLDIKKCIDICKSGEAASTHFGAMSKPAEIHKVSKTKPRPKEQPLPKDQHPHFASGAKCKFCHKRHVLKKELCPAWGRKCNACGKKNHWSCSEVCGKRVVHTLSRDFDSPDSDSDIASIDSLSAYVNGVKTSKNKPIYCEMNVNDTPIKLQVDCGATVNIMPQSKIGNTSINRDNVTLEMWNKKQMNTLGTCKLPVENPKTTTKYLVKFVVVEEELTPLLSRKAAEKMKLITVNYGNFESVTGVVTMKNKGVKEQFPDVFDGEVGTLPGTVHLAVEPNADPVIRAAKRIPVELKEPLRTQLDKLVKLGVIEPVDEPTDWVNQITIATKKNGSLRICIDPRSLNQVLKRERYQLPVLDDILPDLSKAKVFSKVDLSHGYWHCVLDEESSLLTTFATPFGRYKWLRLPFGLSVSSEIFQKRLLQALEGLTGLACIADDVLLYGVGESLEEATVDHDRNLTQLLERCKAKSIKLNHEKMELRVPQLDLMGHRLTRQGLKPDPSKVEAILKLQPPKNKLEVQRLNGTVNYLAKFLPQLSQVTQPLRNLTHQDSEWCWTDVEEKAFQQMKQLVTQAPVLAYYRPEKELVIQCDASNKGLGAALMQEGRPIAYASRALTDAETRYATIEKEMLAVVFSLEKWHQYAFGRPVVIHTDHKPLEAIMKKPLDRAPKRLQGMLLRSLTYDIQVQHCPGKSMHLADMMSRSFLPVEEKGCQGEFETINAVKFLPMSEPRIQEIRNETEKDETLQLLKATILEGWPEHKSMIPVQLTPYYGVRDELGVHDGLIFRGERLVVRQGIRASVKRDIHSSHAGVEGCLRRARESEYWPGMNGEVNHWISTCEPCRQQEISHGKETLMSHDVPNRTWEKVAVDLFSIKGLSYHSRLSTIRQLS